MFMFMGLCHSVKSVSSTDANVCLLQACLMICMSVEFSMFEKKEDFASSGWKF